MRMFLDEVNKGGQKYRFELILEIGVLAGLKGGVAFE